MTIYEVAGLFARSVEEGTAGGDSRKPPNDDGQDEMQGKRRSRLNEYQDVNTLQSPQLLTANPEKEKQQNFVEPGGDFKLDLGSGETHMFERSQGFDVISGGFQFYQRKERITSQNSSVGE